MAMAEDPEETEKAIAKSMDRNVAKAPRTSNLGGAVHDQSPTIPCRKVRRAHLTRRYRLLAQFQ
jgi:hypothetical protein